MKAKHTLQNMEERDAMEYMRDMAINKEKRPDGLEGELFSQVDALNAERKSVEAEMEQTKKHLEGLAQKHQHIVGSADGLVNVLIKQEDARRAV